MLFEIGCIVLKKDKNTKSVIETIIFKKIKGVRLTNGTCLCIKTNKNGFAFFFSNNDPKNAELFFDKIGRERNKFGTDKLKVKKIDLSPMLNHLKWRYELFRLKFNYDIEKGDNQDTIFEERDKHTWIED